ncbi:MAG TPA: LytR C-terminal domain-containing protein [bacterium]|nr:LytR C-terminal domain-containing protein [bacterium]
MQRKVRADDRPKESTQTLDQTSATRTQDPKPEQTQLTMTGIHDPKWDKILNYMIGGLGLVVLILVISLVIRINSSGTSEAETQTNEVPAETSPSTTFDGTQSRPQKIRIEVLNGSGVPKLAAKAADYLRSKGFDVVSTGNAPNSNYKKTIVQDRAGNLAGAQQVAVALGVGESGIIQQKNPQLMLEVTVIVGQDYKSLKFTNPRD